MLKEVIFPLVGGLGIFLYGMKLMSESLQEAAGSQLKTLLAKMTKNKPMGVLSGIAITSMVQSSSVTTVMVVGFVNAGLLYLTEGITVIMGANIGTTITAWIVSLLGFKVKITLFALPSIALGVIFLFSSKRGLKHYGSALVGFGLLFLGLSFMKSAIPDATKSPETFQFIEAFVGKGFLTIFYFILIGAFITVIVQSSSATTTITIALTFSGIIPIEAAFGMILGENIGTTITANIASLAGGINSKRAAISHTLFNLVGVIWAILLFKPMMNLVAFLVETDPLKDQESTRFHIATFHSLFNIMNTLLLVWFVRYIEKTAVIISNIFMGSKRKEDFHGAKLLSAAGTSMSPSLELAQLAGFNRVFLRKTMKNFKNINHLILKKYKDKEISSILEIESALDTYRYRMLESLYEIQDSGVMGKTGKQVLVTADIVKRMEEIGDYFARIARRIRVANENEVSLKKENKETLRKQLAVVDDQVMLLRKNLKAEIKNQPKKQGKGLRLKAQKIFYELEVQANKGKLGKKSEWFSMHLTIDLSQNLDTISKYIDDIIELHRSIS